MVTSLGRSLLRWRHAETTGSGVTVSPGTVIVRSVLDASGNVSKLTLMAKGPPGYDPSIGDWWFGETDPTGAAWRLSRPEAPSGANRAGCGITSFHPS